MINLFSKRRNFFINDQTLFQNYTRSFLSGYRRSKGVNKLNRLLFDSFYYVLDGSLPTTPISSGEEEEVSNRYLVKANIAPFMFKYLVFFLDLTFEEVGEANDFGAIQLPIDELVNILNTYYSVTIIQKNPVSFIINQRNYINQWENWQVMTSGFKYKEPKISIPKNLISKMKKVASKHYSKIN